jgi:hypothetical protein
MPTYRPYAINLGSAITGTTQSGNFAIGTGTPTTIWSNRPGSVTWWMSPDEDLGYLIVRQNGTEPQFWRSAGLTDPAFLSLANSLSRRFGTSPFASASAAYAWLTANGFYTTFVPYVAGLYKTTYSGYFADNVNFFATATPQAFGANPATSVQTTAISEPGSDDGSTFSCQWLGYFKPTTTETYTFFTNSDDASYVWVGSNAVSGFTTANAIVNNGGLHGPLELSGSIALTAGVYYPIRIQFGENGGGDVMTFNYSTPTITKTTTVTGLVFYSTTTNGH